MNSVSGALVRTILAFLLLIVVARFMGRKAISQMTFFDFAVAITLGSVTANIGLGGDNKFSTGVTVLITLALLGISSSLIHIKSFRIRKLMNSEPVVVISNGELIKKNMRKIRLSLNNLNSLLRQKNCFNISDVHFAVMESEGELSVLLKADKQPLTPADMQMHPPEKGLTRELIIDGVIKYENLACTNLTEKWLLNELETNGIHSVKEVFFAALDCFGKLYISKGGKRTEHPGEYGIE